MPLRLTISVLMPVPYSNTRFTSPGSVANILFMRTSGKDFLSPKMRLRTIQKYKQLLDYIPILKSLKRTYFVLLFRMFFHRCIRGHYSATHRDTSGIAVPQGY